MNTLHLKYAVEVERTGSITQAAENLFMAQPNLSKAIKELEENMGITIFERSSKGAVLTQKGAEFMVYAKNILAQLEKMESLQIPDASLRQSFNVCIPRGSYIASGFTRFVSGLDMEKEIDVNIKETNSMQTISNVADGRFNLGIVRYSLDYENYFLDYIEEKNLRYEQIWDFEYLVVMSTSHPLAEVAELKKSDLEGYVEIVHGDTSIPYIQPDSLRRPEGAKGQKRVYVYERCNQFDMLEHIPLSYMWVSPIPDEWLRRYGLVQRKCKSSLNRYKDILVYPKGYKLSELDRRFIDKLFESKNEVAFKEYI